MLNVLRLANVVLLVSIVACIAGTLAGLIVFVPFLAGAWALNLVALVGYEHGAGADREHASQRGGVVRIPARAEERGLRRAA